MGGFAYREFLVELVGEQRVGQLSEVQLAQRADAVDVLDVNIFGQVRYLLRVKLMPDEEDRKNKATVNTLILQKNATVNHL